MSNPTFNKFKSTTVYGNFQNLDYKDGTVIANGGFQKHLSVGGNLTIGTETSTATEGVTTYTNTGGNKWYNIYNNTNNFILFKQFNK